MIVALTAEYADKIAANIETKIFERIKNNTFSFDVVNNLCSFYDDLRNIDEDGEVVDINVDENIANILADAIKDGMKLIIEDADNLDYLCEVINLYNSITEEDETSSYNAENTWKKEDKNEGEATELKDKKNKPKENVNKTKEEDVNINKNNNKEKKYEEKAPEKEEKKIEVDYVENPQLDFDDEQLY